jgi:hypothetical protein
MNSGADLSWILFFSVMQDLEPPTRPEGNGDDSTLRSDAGSDFDDGHEPDVVEDFARRLDQSEFS